MMFFSFNINDGKFVTGLVEFRIYLIVIVFNIEKSKITTLFNKVCV